MFIHSGSKEKHHGDAQHAWTPQHNRSCDHNSASPWFFKQSECSDRFFSGQGTLDGKLQRCSYANTSCRLPWWQKQGEMKFTQTPEEHGHRGQTCGSGWEEKEVRRWTWGLFHLKPLISRSDILKEERHNGTAIKERWRSKGMSRSVKAEMDGRMSEDEWGWRGENRDGKEEIKVERGERRTGKRGADVGLRRWGEEGQREDEAKVGRGRNWRIGGEERRKKTRRKMRVRWKRGEGRRRIEVRGVRRDRLRMAKRRGGEEWN